MILLTIGVFISNFSNSQFNLLQLSFSLFLILISLNCQSINLKPIVYCILICAFALTPIAFILKEGDSFGDPAGNANSLAQLFASGVLIVYWFVIDSKNFRKLIFLIIPSFILLAFIILIKSRGSILFLSAGILTIYFIYSKSNKKLNFKYCLILLIFTFTGLVLFFQYFKTLPNIEFRINLLKAGFQILSDNWFFGIGDNQLNKQLPLYWDKDTNLLSGAGEAEYHIHNEYLQRFIEGGIFTFLSFVFLIIFSIKNAIQFIKSTNYENKKWAIPLLSIFIGMCIQITFDRILSFPSSGLLFYFLAAVLMSLPNEANKKSELPNYFILIVSIIYFMLIYPFLTSQFLLLKNIEWTNETTQKLEFLQKTINKDNNKDQILQIIDNELAGSDKETKNKIKQILENKEIVSSETCTAIYTNILDVKYDWSKHYETIIKICDFPDLKVIAYKNYLRLLSIEKNAVKSEQLIKQMITEFPSINLPYIIYYYQMIQNRKFDNAENILVNALKYSNDPLIQKMMALHQIKYNNNLNIELIDECLKLRKNLERNPRYAKKYIIQRFEYIHQYYIPFISLSLEKGDKKFAMKLMEDFYYEYRIKDKQTFELFKDSLKIAYPEFINDFDNTIKS